MEKESLNGDELDIEDQSKLLFDNDIYDPLDKSYHSVEKRSAYKFQKEMNSPKTVEMLVVVDKNMYHKHGDANITTYTLTLFNMVSLCPAKAFLFLHESVLCPLWI